MSRSAKQEGLEAKIGRWSAAFKRRFFRMTMREKLLAMLFVVALIGLWLMNQLGRHGSAWEAIQAAGREKESQMNWLAVESQIRADYERVMAEVPLESLPTKDEVSSRIDAIVRRNNFTQFDFAQARSETLSELTFHTIPLTLQKVTYSQIKSFCDELRRTLPSVTLERISIRPQPKDDQFLDVSFILKSIEYTK